MTCEIVALSLCDEWLNHDSKRIPRSLRNEERRTAAVGDDNGEGWIKSDFLQLTFLLSFY